MYEDQARFIIVPYSELSAQLSPYVEDLLEVANIDEFKLVNEILYLYHHTQGNLTPEMLYYAAQRMVMEILLTDKIDESEYDTLAGSVYEALEMLCPHFKRVLDHLGHTRQLEAVAHYFDDIVLS